MQAIVLPSEFLRGGLQRIVISLEGRHSVHMLHEITENIALNALPERYCQLVEGLIQTKRLGEEGDDTTFRLNQTQHFSC